MTFGIGAALLGVAIGLQVDIGRLYGEVEEVQPDTAGVIVTDSRVGYYDRRERAEREQIAAITGFAVGGALLATGITLLVVDAVRHRRDGAEAPRLSLSVRSDAVMLSAELCQVGKPPCAAVGRRFGGLGDDAFEAVAIAGSDIGAAGYLGSEATGRDLWMLVANRFLEERWQWTEPAPGDQMAHGLAVDVREGGPARWVVAGEGESAARLVLVEEGVAVGDATFVWTGAARALDVAVDAGTRPWRGRPQARRVSTWSSST